MKILHTADWHLSAQGSRIDPESGLNARLMDFYRCAKYSVEEGLRQGAELVVIPGDAFNSAKPSPTELYLFREAVRPALEKGIPVILLLGNHDMPRNQAEKNAIDPLRGIEGLTVVDHPGMFDAWRGTIGDINSRLTISPDETAVRNFTYQVISPTTGEVFGYLESVPDDIHAGLETALQQNGFKLITQEQAQWLKQKQDAAA